MAKNILTEVMKFVDMAVDVGARVGALYAASSIGTAFNHISIGCEQIKHLHKITNKMTIP